MWHPMVMPSIEPRLDSAKLEDRVRFEVTEQTRQAIDDHLSQRRDTPSPYLFRVAVRQAIDHTAVRATVSGGGSQ